ncbi:M23 family metallopeptidase [Mucilaginibacter sp. CSA2-8R]|uniref:M23 family metallopeptidase n=1 Tax=Mucilaginibacter sp. CSA2-8R TaxID=3141542 RepID=UPI00315D9584
MKKLRLSVKHILVVSFFVALSSCSEKGPMALFKKMSPHDAYAQRLKDAGLDRSAMGNAWLQKSETSVTNALNIDVPYKETGYFSAEKIPAAALRFNAQRGQKLHISLSKKPTQNFAIYMDLLEERNSSDRKLVASADTIGLLLDYEIKTTGKYILRLHPELLSSGEYTVSITSGPSLSFPVSAMGKPSIGSFWGDGRDNGGRKHEGIDIFAPKLTPAVAAAEGTVTNVTENKLGGLVVFMHPNNRDYSLYYAHLDKQLVQNGQNVRIGDTIGLVGNTGNARTTPSHLHFGIYTNGGAINPLPFVDRAVKNPKPISAKLNLLDATARTINTNTRLYVQPDEKAMVRTTLPISTVIQIEAATDDWYKVSLPDGTQGYIYSKNVIPANTLRKANVKTTQPLLDLPDTLNGARITTLASGQAINIKGSFKNYFLITDKNDNTGWMEAERK